MESKLKEYEGGDPDSKEAFFARDISGSEDEDVVVDDFVWHRKKSNENLTDTGQGKGHSFYLSRHVFDDDFYNYVPNPQNPENSKVLGIVFEKVMVVIEFEEDDGDTKRIISSWEVEEHSELSDVYWKNRRKEEKRMNQKLQGSTESTDRRTTRFISDTDKDVVYEYIRKKLQEKLALEEIPMILETSRP